VYKFLVGKLLGKRPLGRPRRRWMDNVRMYLWCKWMCRVLVVKPEGKRPLSRPRRKRVDNIIMDLWAVLGI